LKIAFNGDNMIDLIQRVASASVEINQNVVGEINQGILLMLGVEKHAS